MFSCGGPRWECVLVLVWRGGGPGVHTLRAIPEQMGSAQAWAYSVEAAC